MANTVTDRLDKSNPAAAATRTQPAAALNAIQVLSNARTICEAFPILTAALDTDTLQNSDYASVAGTPTPATLVSKYNAVLARLDLDTTVTDTTYASLCSMGSLADAPRALVALLLKLDSDAGVPATTYRSGLAAYTALLATPLNG